MRLIKEDPALVWYTATNFLIDPLPMSLKSSRCLSPIVYATPIPPFPLQPVCSAQKLSPSLFSPTITLRQKVPPQNRARSVQSLSTA